MTGRVHRFTRTGAVAAAVLAAMLGGAAAAQTPPPAPGLAKRPDGASVDRILDIVVRVVDLKAATTKIDQGDQTRLNLATDVLFEFGSAQLSPKAQQTLQAAADTIKARRVGTVQVDGAHRLGR